MPRIFKVGAYTIFFWSNEGDPLEPIHVHIAERASSNATKVWITSAGKCYLCNNNSKIPDRILRDVMRVVESRSSEIIGKWLSYFEEISYYC